MTRYVYVSPILPEKTEWIKDLCQERTQTDWQSAHEQQKREFWQFLGINQWTAWIQYTQTQNYFIHCIEGESFERMSAALRTKINEKHPVALWIQDFYRQGLGKNYDQSPAEAQVEEILDVSVDIDFLPNSPCISRAFCYPLLPAKAQEHIAFCQECQGPQRPQFEAILQNFGIQRITKFIQRSKDQDYLVYYQELDLERCRQFQQTDPEHTYAPCQWNSRALTAHTGLSPEERKPKLEFLISANPEKVALAGAHG